VLITGCASAGRGGSRSGRCCLFEQFLELRAEAGDHFAFILFAFLFNGGEARIQIAAQPVEFAADAADFHFEGFKASGHAPLVFLFNQPVFSLPGAGGLALIGLASA